MWWYVLVIFSVALLMYLFVLFDSVFGCGCCFAAECYGCV